MALHLYRRHNERCEGKHPKDSHSGELEERAKKWTRCSCPIIAAGAMRKTFKRRKTGRIFWDDAKAVAARWEAAGRWPDDSDPSPAPVVTEAGPGRERRQERFTALLHHAGVGLLRESFYALKRQAAPGVDGVTWKEYETGLEDRIVDLHSRVHRGAYQAQPSRRVYIPKADGRQRPLGIAALEDKIVQQAAVTILNQIYEVDFKGFSYGFCAGGDQRWSSLPRHL
jgi:hypothetical protein